MHTNLGEITSLLTQMKRGDNEAGARLMSFVYQDLRRLAGAYMRRERPEHTLQPTSLVNEAYVRLLRPETFDWKDRAHFMGTAAMMMRRVLVEHARARAASKRGGPLLRIELQDPASKADAQSANILDLNAALIRLSEFDQRLSKAVELRYFAGLSIAETAAVLGVCQKTVKRDWVIAQAWLRGELARGGYGVSQPLARS